MYKTPEYKLEVISSEDIMEFSPNNLAVSNDKFDFGDGKGEVNVTKASATAKIEDLLF
ncbi:MAG: hypothetical protein IJ004_01200 [Clostridia bacterium]|nr:hypothetical protein [Clostridia bacterium]